MAQASDTPNGGLVRSFPREPTTFLASAIAALATWAPDCGSPAPAGSRCRRPPFSWPGAIAMLATWALGCGSLVAAEPRYQRLPFSLPADVSQVTSADLDGDGRRELLAQRAASLRVYRHGANGFDFAAGFHEIPAGTRGGGGESGEVPPSGGNSGTGGSGADRGSGGSGGSGTDRGSGGSDGSGGNSGSGGSGGSGAGGESPERAMGWDLDGHLLTLHDGRELRAWQLDGDGEPRYRTVLDGLPGRLPRGLHRMRLARDVNGDGLRDLVIPGNGTLHVFLNQGADRYAEPVAVQVDLRVRTILAARQLDGRVGQAITIPFLELRDLNGDGSPDLISRTDERLAVYLATATGGDGYFPATPSYALDLAAIEEELGEFDVDRLDFSNLTGALSLTHEELLEDVNGDGIADLLVRAGGKVSLFTGSATGMALERPTQVLRSGGNVLGVFVRDEDHDGRPDLWLWRVEPISVGDLFLWLALSGSIAIEAFVYRNEGEQFARRPARRLSVDVKFPSVLRLASAYRDIRTRLRGEDAAPVIPTARGELDTRRERQDLLVAMGDQLRGHLNALSRQVTEAEFMGDLGYSRERDSYTLDLRTVMEDAAVSANADLARLGDAPPDFTLSLAEHGAAADVFLLPVNADAIDDILVITGEADGQLHGVLLLSM